MDFHLSRDLRLHTEPKYKNLYSWAIYEVDANGSRVGDDQIPWEWSLHFTATSCTLVDNVDMESDLQEELAQGSSKVKQRQLIRAPLNPGRSWEDEDSFRHTQFSMFGTDRTIHSFELMIYAIADPAERERCTAWGTVSYTSELDFRTETQDDSIIFYLFVKPETFARYAAKVAHGLVNEITLRIASVSGFYSEWSPSISTQHVKVLAAGSEQKVALPSGQQFKPPRLGYVGEAELYVNRRLDFQKLARFSSDVEATTAASKKRDAADVPTDRLGSQSTSVDPQILKMLGSIRRAAWFVVSLLALIFFAALSKS